jgi:PadR family transcriptional regulator, regulatory protein PadR
MNLGEFEEVVLLTVAIMNGKAYGIGIIDEVEKRTNRTTAIGAIQTVLKRMEEKGFVSSEFGEATKERGGKRKRYYKITTEGSRALTDKKLERDRLWKAVPKLSLSYETV